MPLKHSQSMIAGVMLIVLCESGLAATPNRSPSDLALTPDGRWAITANTTSNTTSLVDLANGKVSIAVGNEPRGVAFSADSKVVYVALSGEDAVVAVDLQQQKMIARTTVGREPWHLALTPNGERLAVENALSRTVTVLDAATLSPTHTVKLRGRNLRHVAVSPDGRWAYVPFIAERGSVPTRWTRPHVARCSKSPPSAFADQRRKRF